MRMIMVGPPGAGKGTQAAKLLERFQIPHVASGDMLRSAVADGTPLGREAEGYMKRGALVPDALVIAMVVDRLGKADCQRGFMLDGFPRTLPQAESLDEALGKNELELDAVVLIEVPDELIVERITGRRLDPETNEIYHLKFQPPAPEIEDRLVQRDDDTERAVQARLDKYHSETAPIVPYYESRNLLRRVDGVGSPDEVADRISTALGIG